MILSSGPAMREGQAKISKRIVGFLGMALWGSRPTVCGLI
jgi:hypothetical protein